MATKSLPSLKSYPKACLKAEDNDDLFSELPEEILVSIMSSFTIEDAARFSLVSRQCERTWRYFPVLIFKDYHSKEKFWDSWEAIVEEKACFVWRVDRVLEKHLGTTIDELRIIFDLELSSQSYVDKWVAVALDKQVKRLELDFQSNLRKMHVHDGRNFRPLPICFDLPPRFTGGFKSPFLTSLCVRYVNVTNEFVDYLPLSCPLLEILCIQGSRNLTRITGSLQVKQLEVSYCRNLEKIDVSARKLLSLTLNFVYPIELHIVDAPSLFKMSIGEAKILPHAFDNLSDILSQLVYLNLRFCLILPLMRGLVNGVPMPKLRHLELTVTYALIDSSLYQCIFVIQACPSLEKLTLKTRRHMSECWDMWTQSTVRLDQHNGHNTTQLERFIVRKVADRQPRKWIGCGFPLKCLKTLELVGYRGIAMDLELAFFVLDYASMFEEIIVDFVPLNDNDKRERLVMLQMKLPQGVKLTAINLSTKVKVSLPHLRDLNSYVTDNLAVNSFGRFKVVHVYGEMSYEKVQMCLFTVGVDKAWSCVELQGIPAMNQQRFALLNSAICIAGFHVLVPGVVLLVSFVLPWMSIQNSFISFLAQRA